MKILLVEDDREMAQGIAQALAAQGHEVEVTYDGNAGAERARAGEHMAVIVDRMLPGMDGLAIVKALRAEGLRTPILFLTTMSGIDDRVEGLEGGADDYLTKPFAAAELLARVNAITRRAEGHGETTILKTADLELDLIRRTVTRQGRPATFRLRNSNFWNI